MFKISLISLFLLSSLNATTIPERTKNYINTIINKCIVEIKNEEKIVNQEYLINNKKYDLDAYQNYLDKKQSIFLKESFCFEKGKRIVEKMKR
jgi:hypothetical protein